MRSAFPTNPRTSDDLEALVSAQRLLIHSPLPEDLQQLRWISYQDISICENHRTFLTGADNCLEGFPLFGRARQTRARDMGLRRPIQYLVLADSMTVRVAVGPAR